MDYKRVLIFYFTNGMSSREISETTGDGKTTVNEFLKRFRECEELSYPLPEEVTNEFIAGCLYKKAGNLVNSTGILTRKKSTVLWQRRERRSSTCGRSTTQSER